MAINMNAKDESFVVTEILKVFGLENKKIIRFELTMEVDSAVTVQTTELVTGTDLSELKEVIKNYTLEKKEE